MKTQTEDENYRQELFNRLDTIEELENKINNLRATNAELLDIAKRLVAHIEDTTNAYGDEGFPLTIGIMHLGQDAEEAIANAEREG